MLSRKLFNILQTETEAVRGLGGEGGDDRLRYSLTETRAHAVRMFYITATMAVVLFIVMLVLLFMFSSDPTILATLGSFCGTGVVGLILIVLRISREISQAGILMDLVSQLPRDDVLPALQALLRANTSVANQHTSL